MLNRPSCSLCCLRMKHILFSHLLDVPNHLLVLIGSYYTVYMGFDVHLSYGLINCLNIWNLWAFGVLLHLLAFSLVIWLKVSLQYMSEYTLTTSFISALVIRLSVCLSPSFLPLEMWTLSHFLGIEFTWQHLPGGHLAVSLTQQSFIESLLTSLSKSIEGISTYTTPY